MNVGRSAHGRQVDTSIRLGFAQLWVIAALALVALVTLLVPMPAVDLAYQLRAGEAILQTGTIPASDSWTFTVAGAAWTDQQWLAQTMFAAWHRLGGWELLAVMRAGLATAAVGLLIATSVARGTALRPAAILGLVAFALAAPALALRPQLFGIVVFAALLWLVATRVDHPRRLWVAPLLVVLWANVHGSFVLAPLVLGYAWLDDVVHERPARNTLAVLSAGLIATLITPFGASVWVYAVSIGTNPVIAGQVSEWQRTTPFSVPGALFWVSAIAGMGVLVRGRTALRWPDWIWFAGMAAVGAWTIRGLAWWPFGLVFVLALALPAAWPGLARVDRRRPARGPAILALVFGFLVVVALPWWRPADALTGRVGLLTYAPTGIAMAVRQTVAAGAGDRVLAPQTWASWLEWSAPEARTLLDSRFELFPADVWADYEVAAGGGAASATVLDRRAVDVLVLPAGVQAPPTGWTETYRDADGAVYVRSRGVIGAPSLVPSGDPATVGASAMVAEQGRSVR